MEPASFALGFLVSYCAVFLCIVLLRLFFNPLSSIPGPQLAAATRLYELYYDIVKGGRLPWKILELHDQYGPVVRIAPDEVHIADPEYAYRHFNTRADKYGPHKNRFGFPEATSETPEAELHKNRYHALAPAFSRKAVADLEPLIISKVDKMCQRLEGFRADKSPIDLRPLFLCMTTDTLTTFGFGFSFDLLDDPGLAPGWRAALDAALRNVHSILVRLKPGLAMTRQFEQRNKQIARDTIAQYNEKGWQQSEEDVHDNQTVFQRLLSSDLPEEEKSYDRLWQEASSLMGAGTETVANMLSFIIYHLHANPDSLRQLRSDLQAEMPNPDETLPPWTRLESLPYLSAVINEGLRMSLSVPSRMLRILPADITVHGYNLLKGTVVSMSTITLHRDADLWPEPDKWRPERFLGSEARSRKDLYSFSKGTRACVGMNFAYAQLYLTLAALIRRHTFELYETSLQDVEPCFDAIVAMTRPGSKGVRVVVL